MKRNADFKGDVTLPLSDFLSLIDENRRLSQFAKGETKEMENRLRAQIDDVVMNELDMLRSEKRFWTDEHEKVLQLQMEIADLKKRNLWKRILNR